MTVGELIMELSKYPIDTEVVLGDVTYPGTNIIEVEFDGNLKLIYLWGGR